MENKSFYESLLRFELRKLFAKMRLLYIRLTRQLSWSTLSIRYQTLAQLSTGGSTIDYTSTEYQFLHRSQIPTYHFQKSLRRLPIPKLDASCRRYLDAVKAITGEGSEEFRNAEKVVNDFQNGDGPELQAELLANDKSNRHTSYISEPWFDIYLRSRVPCPINYNPYMMYSPDPDTRYNDQLIRATNFVISYGRFKRALDAECLAPEVFHLNPKKSDTNLFRRVCRALPSRVSWFGAVAFKAFPLDMSQHKSLFGGSRIPQRNKDRLYWEENPRHFIVIRHGFFYAVNLFDDKGNLQSPAVVHACLAKILRQTSNSSQSSSSSTNLTADNQLGVLTTLDRDTWADTREELLEIEHGRNAASMTKIDGALFALCLDEKCSDQPPVLKSGADHSALVNALLCGGDGSNRWFDKCFQLIVDGHGMATINFEHAWGDGVPVLRLMEETIRDITKNRFVKVGDAVDETLADKNMQKIEFTLTDSLRAKICDARKKFVAKTEQLQHGTMEYDALNRDNIKKYRLSPDSVMQLAIQHAFYKIYKEFVPTYESCSTAAFLKGRTECMRSATVATRATVLALESSSSDPTKLYEQLQQCSAFHSELVKQASLGQGFDRHLLGLKITAERLGRPVPQFFKDSTYLRMGHFVISTSTLSTDTIVFGGFGPVVKDGFGIGYNVVGSQLGAVVSTYKESHDAKMFCKQLATSLDRIRDILEKSAANIDKK